LKRCGLLLLAVCTILVPMSVTANAVSLKPCPDSPNCVSSQAADTDQFIEPLRYTGTAESAWNHLIEVLQAAKRTVITEQTESYMHAEVTSLIFHFVDDVEFILQPDEQLIQVRSASRTGHSDFGVNRRRVETLRKAFEVSLEAL